WEWGGQLLAHYDNSGNQTLPSLDGYDNGIYLNGTGPVDFNSTYPTSTQGYAQVMNDGQGNAICAWVQNGNTVYIQKYSQVDGSTMWGSAAVQLSTNGNGTYRTGPVITPDGIGGAFVGWQTSSNTIYSQHVIDQSMAPTSQITVNVASPINIGSVDIGSTVTVTNAVTIQCVSGVFPLTITGVSSTSGQATVSSPTIPATLTAGNSVNLTIQEKVPKAGRFNDTLQIYTSDPQACSTPIYITGTGLYARIKSVNPVQLQNQRVGKLATYPYLIRNTGDDTLKITGATFDSGSVSNFNVIKTPNPIVPGGTDTIWVGFTPDSASLLAARLNIVSNDSLYTLKNTPTYATFYVTGIFPHFSATANTIQYPFTIVDLRASSKKFSITNIGTDTLHILNSAFSGTNATEFTDTGNIYPVAIAPGATKTLKITFQPKVTLGAKSATLTINSDDSLLANRNPYTVSLMGTAVAGAPDFASADGIDAGNLKVGKKDTVGYTLSNLPDGTAYLIFSQIELQNSFAGTYRILNLPSMPDTIKVGKSQTLQIEFTATQAGTLPSNLHMITNAAPYPYDIPVSGQGLKSFLAAQSLNFGTVGVNKCATLPMKLTNFGTEPLKIVSITPEGLNTPYYSVLDTANNLTLPAGASTNINVMYCPLSTGVQNIIMRLITDYPDTIFANINGTGVFPGSLQSASEVNFGPVAIQQTIVRPLTIRNIGQTPVTITDQNILGTAPVPFTSSLKIPTVVNPGDSISVTISFNSNTGGLQTATLQLSTSDSIPLNVTLRAYASADPFTADPQLLFVNDTIPGDQTLAQSVTVANFLKSPIQLADLYLAGPDAGAYRILYPLYWPYTIQGQGIDSVTIVFVPNTGVGGTFPASLVIRLQNGDSTIIGLGGTASAPADVRVGGTQPQEYALS
ncbi:MAG TPA: choice-of-anchor D domain-containing protein, partial [Candidatus Kapabacteria bacterium]|nr:choice-of-anchor D domain-containing protein [Candidatus Kapabacteria bacterium]